MGDWRIFLQIYAPLSLTKAFQIYLISAGSISLDSNFKLFSFFSGRYKKSQFFSLAIIKIN